jgi:hypothetical protein
VLDLHTLASEKGVHFEDTQWWTHLSSLKPIGLTCLLAEAKYAEVNTALSTNTKATATATATATTVSDSVVLFCSIVCSCFPKLLSRYHT